MKEKLQQEFNKLYNKEPENIYFSPGRVNLIGEHIDYNGGLVMPCAITLGTYLLIAFNNDNQFRFRSLNFDYKKDIPLQNGYLKEGNEWVNYPLGVINHFLKDGHQLQGLDMLFYGDIPIGSGLSSSASIEIAIAYALNDLFKTGYSKLDLVKIGKAVENDFIGLQSGIMDQFAVTFGEKDKALLLDCNTLKYDPVSCTLGDYSLVIINTNKSRKLSESKYNERQQECQYALKRLQQKLTIKHLCDINTDTFNQYEYLIDDEAARKRAQHVIEENDRVKLAAKELSANNIIEFGRLMYASHNSLRDLYEVSGLELDTIISHAKTCSYVAGARMTGAGFGGCAIALVKTGQFEVFSKEITEYYTNRIGYSPSIYQSHIGNGVDAINKN